MASRKDSSSTQESGFEQWQVEYESALQETDRKALFKRIEVAESTILARREILMQSSDGSAERQALKLALEKVAQSEEGSLEVFVIGKCVLRESNFAHFSQTGSLILAYGCP